jgi:hypothetical protein
VAVVARVVTQGLVALVVLTAILDRQVQVVRVAAVVTLVTAVPVQAVAV